MALQGVGAIGAGDGRRRWSGRARWLHHLAASQIGQGEVEQVGLAGTTGGTKVSGAVGIDLLHHELTHPPLLRGGYEQAGARRDGGGDGEAELVHGGRVHLWRPPFSRSPRPCVASAATPQGGRTAWEAGRRERWLYKEGWKGQECRKTPAPMGQNLLHALTSCLRYRDCQPPRVPMRLCLPPHPPAPPLGRKRFPYGRTSTISSPHLGKVARVGDSRRSATRRIGLRGHGPCVSVLRPPLARPGG